jgi:hypothetical protein
MDIHRVLTDEPRVLLWLAVNCEGVHCEGEQFLVSLGVLQSEGAAGDSAVGAGTNRPSRQGDGRGGCGGNHGRCRPADAGGDGTGGGWLSFPSGAATVGCPWAEATGRQGAAAGSTADTGPQTLTAMAQAQAAAGSAAPPALPELAALGGQRQKARARGQQRAALPTPACGH